jgi:hypothetical protein
MKAIEPAADEVVFEDPFPFHFHGDQKEARPEGGLPWDCAGVTDSSDPSVVLSLAAQALASHGLAD